MKMTLSVLCCVLTSAAFLTGCDDASKGVPRSSAPSAEAPKAPPAPADRKAPAETKLPQKPNGVPDKVYKKVKTIETDHNADLDKALNP